MLELMRRGVKTWVAKILLALLIVSFAVWGIGDIFTGSANSTVGAVGDTKVDAERFARTIRRQQVQMTMQRRQAVSLADMRAAGLDRQTLGTLLREAAYTEELGALGLGVSTEEVARMIRTNPAFVNSEGTFDPSRYAERLGQSRFGGAIEGGAGDGGCCAGAAGCRWLFPGARNDDADSRSLGR